MKDPAKRSKVIRRLAAVSLFMQLSLVCLIMVVVVFMVARL